MKKTTMKNKIIALGLSAALLVSFTGCSREKVMDKDGNLLEYTESEVIKKDGFFIHVNKSKDETVYNPLLKPDLVGYQSFSGEKRDNQAQSSRFIMISGHDNLIPVITGDNLLVYVNSTSTLPSTIKFERFEDRGYTFGALFQTRDNESGLFIKNNSKLGSSYFIEDSSFEDKWKNKKNIDSYSFDSVGEYAVGERNIDENGAFKGLEEDASYEITTFIGTQYETLVIKADTHYLVSVETIVVNQKDSMIRTKNGYAVVMLPSTLESGYYMINDTYLFYYDKENSTAPTTDQFIKENMESILTDPSETTETYYEMTFYNGDEDDHEDPGDGGDSYES